MLLSSSLNGYEFIRSSPQSIYGLNLHYIFFSEAEQPSPGTPIPSQRIQRALLQFSNPLVGKCYNICQEMTVSLQLPPPSLFALPLRGSISTMVFRSEAS